MGGAEGQSWSGLHTAEALQSEQPSSLSPLHQGDVQGAICTQENDYLYLDEYMLQKVFPVTYDKLKFFADIFNVNSKVYLTFDIWKWVDGWNKFIQARRKA